MRVIQARNVNDAFIKGVRLLQEYGEYQNSRAGPVLVMDTPVTTVYSNPTERVLFHVRRDANPFFHLMEALWMLAGRNDATWLDQFVKDFSERFAEDGGVQHGAYGFRWRNHFDMEGGGNPNLPDQLETIIRLLRTNPDDRRIVLQMWDAPADLGVNKKDVPCNTQAYFRVRVESQGYEYVEQIAVAEAPPKLVLDLTVCCRSNDVVWGAYGANAVHFSMLQEYIAAQLGAKVGNYYQVSNNFHVYKSVFDAIKFEGSYSPDYYRGEALPKAKVYPLVEYSEAFDLDLKMFMESTSGEPSGIYRNDFFPAVAVPMKEAYALWRQRKRQEAFDLITTMPSWCDWRIAAELWFRRRMLKKVSSEEGVAR